MEVSQSLKKGCPGKDKPKQPCSGYPEGSELDEMVVNYRSKFFDSLVTLLQSLKTYTDFICGARNEQEAPDKEKYRKNLHQYRMPSETVGNAFEELKKASLDRYNTFADIHAAVYEATKNVGQFGTLAVYDFTQRYCYSRGIEPDGVYLHAGVATGAKELKRMGYDVNIIDLGERGSMIELASLPAPIAGLGTLHAENFLCIYKDLLGKLAASKNKSNN